MKHIQFANGLHYYKKALDIHSQKTILDWINNIQLKVSVEPTIFRTMLPLIMPDIKNISNKLILDTNILDPSILIDPHTHMFIVKYIDNIGLPYHIDQPIYGGYAVNPILSISIGNTCRFKYMLNGFENNIELQSGDILIFGGDCRNMLHKIDNILPNTCPFNSNSRINITTRFIK